MSIIPGVYVFIAQIYCSFIFVMTPPKKKKTTKKQKQHTQNLSTTHTYLGVRLYWEEELVTQEFRHIAVLCDAPCTPSLFSLSSRWVLWRSGEERRGGWRWWRLASQADIPCGQRTDGTRLLPHTSMPGILLVCSRGSFELVFTPTMGESWERRRLLRAVGKKTVKVDVVQGGLIKGVYKLVC